MEPDLLYEPGPDDDVPQQENAEALYMIEPNRYLGRKVKYYSIKNKEDSEYLMMETQGNDPVQYDPGYTPLAIPVDAHEPLLSVRTTVYAVTVARTSDITAKAQWRTKTLRRWSEVHHATLERLRNEYKERMRVSDESAALRTKLESQNVLRQEEQQLLGGTDFLE